MLKDTEFACMLICDFRTILCTLTIQIVQVLHKEMKKDNDGVPASS